MKSKRSASATARPGPDHHLWNNHGTFWCHFTVHLPDYTKQRLRLALGTRDFTEARRLRDSLLVLFAPLLAHWPAQALSESAKR
jgi:hypothetical protein